MEVHERRACSFLPRQLLFLSEPHKDTWGWKELLYISSKHGQRSLATRCSCFFFPFRQGKKRNMVRHNTGWRRRRILLKEDGGGREGGGGGGGGGGGRGEAKVREGTCSLSLWNLHMGKRGLKGEGGARGKMPKSGLERRKNSWIVFSLSLSLSLSSSSACEFHPCWRISEDSDQNFDLEKKSKFWEWSLK